MTMTTAITGKEFVQLHPNTRQQTLAQKLDYVVVDGKPYSTETGEYLGDKYVHDLVPRRTAGQYKVIESKRILDEHEVENGGFVFTFFKQSRMISERFPTLNNSDIARLMYLGTYIAWNTGRIQYDNGRVIDREGFEKLMGLSTKRSRELFKRYVEAEILTERDDCIFMNPTVFYRGNVKTISPAVSDMQHTRLFKKTIRDLYEKTNGRTVGQLALVYSVMPFLNFETNTICFNPDETDLDRLRPMGLEKLAVLLGYANAGKLKTALNRVQIDGQVVFNFYENPRDRREKRITVNPRTIFAGTGEQLAAIMVQFN